MRKQRHREIEELAQGHTADKWENWDGTSQAGSRVRILENQMDSDGCGKAWCAGVSRAGGSRAERGQEVNRG